MSTPTSTTDTTHVNPKFTVEPPRGRKIRAPRAAKPQAPAPKPAPPAKPVKSAPAGIGIRPAKRKLAAADTKAKFAYVIKCTAAPDRLRPGKDESPTEYIASHEFRLIESDAALKGWASGQPLRIYHAGNSVDLGTYVVIPKAQVPAGKLIAWTVA
jgi:hypothetical protein